MSPKHTLIQTRLRHQARKFSYHVELLQMPNGVQGEYAYIQHPGAAIAVPVSSSGEFILVKQYRFPIAKYLLEFPAGTLESGEDHGDTIQRELEEETGYSAGKWDYMGAFYICPGYSNEVIHAYLARDLHKLAVPPAQDADEDIEVVAMTRRQIHELITLPSGVMTLDAKSVTSFYLALAVLDKN
jgi:ADP-ribose pyrophosphatase